MGRRSRRASRRSVKKISACVVVCGVGIVAGLLAGPAPDKVQANQAFSQGQTDPGASRPANLQIADAATPSLLSASLAIASLSSGPVSAADLSPSQVVAMRFEPEGGMPTAQPKAQPSSRAAAKPAPAGYDLASASERTVTLPPLKTASLSPHPTYASLTDTPFTGGAFSNEPAANELTSGQAVQDKSSSSEQALAYAPATPVEHAPAVTTPPVVKRVVAPPRPVSPTNTVLNNAQIASLHERLKLSNYQQQMWPAVESALRDIVYKQARNDPSRTSSYRTQKEPPLIDTASPEVQRLKSAAIPLIMSMSEEQKQEVRNMARLMGLEQLASAF